ncbi:MAG TPA: hypothetical protein VIH59_23710 [Candidatus Tectomicrobia bacterium]|jgi:hypothetical protein
MSETSIDSPVDLDDLVERIAAQAFESRIFTVYTNTRHAQNRAVKGHYPHLVGVGQVSQRVEIVGMVETAETLHNLEAAARRWQALEPLQAAIYLYVPRGYCVDARTLCLRERMRISDFRHYWFDENGLHVHKCFA